MICVQVVSVLTGLWICFLGGQAGREVQPFGRGHLAALCAIQSLEHLTKYSEKTSSVKLVQNVFAHVNFSKEHKKLTL